MRRCTYASSATVNVATGSFGPPIVRVVCNVFVDVEGVARKLAARAVRAKSRKATALRGAIVVHASEVKELK